MSLRRNALNVPFAPRAWCVAVGAGRTAGTAEPGGASRAGLSLCHFSGRREPRGQVASSVLDEMAQVSDQHSAEQLQLRRRGAIMAVVILLVALFVLGLFVWTSRATQRVNTGCSGVGACIHQRS